jgi:hypothetical protein
VDRCSSGGQQGAGLKAYLIGFHHKGIKMVLGGKKGLNKCHVSVDQPLITDLRLILARLRAKSTTPLITIPSQKRRIKTRIPDFNNIKSSCHGFAER